MLFNLLTFVSATLVLMVLFDLMTGANRERSPVTASDPPPDPRASARRDYEEASTVAMA
jgi:hypothetical protein